MREPERQMVQNRKFPLLQQAPFLFLAQPQATMAVASAARPAPEVVTTTMRCRTTGPHRLLREHPGRDPIHRIFLTI